DRVAALGEGVRTFVEHLVEDLDALVGQAHLVGVRVHQRPPDAHRVPVLDPRVQLAPDVLDGFADLAEQRLEPVEEVFRAGTHDLSCYGRASIWPNRPARCY